MKNDLNLNLLRVFHVAARHSSFTRAADELHLTQPGISKHIMTLEEYYGARLFDRLGKKIVLTQAGELLLEAAGAAFSLIDHAEMRIAELGGVAAGKLQMGCCVTIGTYIIPELLVRFRQKYPGVEMRMETAFNSEVVGKVLDASIELGFVGHVTPDPRLAVEIFRQDRLVLIVPGNHPWATRKSEVRLDELAEQVVLLSKPGSGTWRIVAELVEKAGGSLTRTMEMGTTEAVKQGVAAGLGISIISRHALGRELPGGQIVTVPLAGSEPTRDLYLVYLKDRHLSAAAQAFLGVAFGRERNRRT